MPLTWYALCVLIALPQTASQTPTSQTCLQPEAAPEHSLLQHVVGRSQVLLDEEAEMAETSIALAGVTTNLIMCVAAVSVFSILRREYPAVYMGNVMAGAAPELHGNWIASSLQVNFDKVAASLGLDAALALEYASFGAQLVTVIGLPFLVVLCPLHRWYGEEGLVDVLASISLSNVKQGHPWLYHLHGLAVLWVVVAVRHMAFRAQERFVTKRMAWLKSLPYPRASAILVEGIPDGYRSSDRVFQFFTENVGPVAHVTMVKDTATLEAAVAARDVTKGQLEDAKQRFEREGQRPRMRSFCTMGADAMDQYSRELSELEALIKAERARTKHDSPTSSAFVIFRSRKDAEVAKVVQFDDGAWVVHDAPEASGIRWRDLYRSGTGLEYVGYIMIALLFANFSPICLGISAAASEINAGRFQAFWAALVPTLGLTIFLSLLPTALLMIFSAFFSLRAEPSAQHQLQIFYFIFQCFFILFLPVLGSDFRSFLQSVQDASLASILRLFSDRIPTSAPFFFNYIVLQWTVSCMELVRMANFLKFLFFRTQHPESEALKMAEPEDQDFYGIGGRTARWNLNLVIGCLFSSVCPLITVVVFVQFMLQRVAYGYLIVFAETRKPDLGGVFWSESLLQLLYCMVFFAVGMSGLLLRRSSSWIPPMISLSGVPIAVASIVQFKLRFHWRALSFPEAVKLGSESNSGAEAMYEQPLLREPEI